VQDINEDSILDFSKMRAFMFDLDGTLIRSTVDFIKLKRETLNRLSELGIDTQELSEKMKTYEIMSRLKEREEQGRLVLPYSTIVVDIASIWDRIELENVDKTEKIAGAENVLGILKKRGIGVGVVTRGCRTYAMEALRITKLLHFVDIVLGRDDTDEAKPSPKPLLRAMTCLNVEASETVMVGDNIEDAICAGRAGVVFVGVLTGLSDREAFVKLGSVRVLESVRELPFLLEK
jgi:HAD superfamily hydrolase (TIGR01549 family)